MDMLNKNFGGVVIVESEITSQSRWVASEFYCKQPLLL